MIINGSRDTAADAREVQPVRARGQRPIDVVDMAVTVEQVDLAVESLRFSDEGVDHRGEAVVLVVRLT